MNHFRSIVSVLALSSVLLAGCDSDRTPSATPTPAPAPAPMGISATVGGSAVKGIIKNGVVEVFDPADTSTALITGTTDDTGAYDLTLPASANFDGDFLLVVVSGADDNSSTMVCDVPEGCEGNAFGADVVLGPDFTLRALVPAPADGATTTVRVNTFTDLATELALSETTLDTGAVENANSQVQALFDLDSADLASIPPLDLSDATAVAAADAATIRATSIGAAILATVAERSGETVGSAISAFRTRLRENGGQLIGSESSNSADVFSLQDVLSHAIAVVERAGASGRAAEVLAQVNARLAEVEAGTPGQLTDAHPSPGAGKSKAEKARQFVGDLQLLLSALNQQDVESQRLAFQNGFETGQSVVGDDLQAIMAGLGEAASAIAAATEAWLADDTITTFTTGSIDVAISTSADGTDITFAVENATLTNEVNVDLSAVFHNEVGDIAAAPPSAPGETVNTDAGSAAFVISGTAANRGLSLTIDDGKLAVSNVTHSETVGQDGTFHAVTELSAMNFGMNVKLMQLGVETPFSFQGRMGVNFSAGRLKEDEEYDPMQYLVATDAFTFENLTVLLSGDMTSGGETVGITIGGRIDGSNLVVGPPAPNPDGTPSDSPFSPDNYPTGTLSVAIRATILGLDGADPTVEFKVVGTQTDFEAGDLALQIKFAGRRFSTTTALFDAPPESVMIRNQDNLLLTLNHDPASDSVSGSITAGEDVLATIEESDTGLLVRFNDGQDPNVQTLTF